MKELYTTPEFTVVLFATEDSITQSKDNLASADDLFGVANS